MSLLLTVALYLAIPPVPAQEPVTCWRYQALSNLYTPPLAADMTPAPGQEILICDSEARRLRCIDATGAPCWEYDGKWTKRLVSAPALSNPGADGLRRIAIANGDGSLTCLCAATGTLLWRREPGPVEWGGALWMPGPAEKEQTVVVATETTGVHAFSEGGDLLWHLSETQASPPLLARGRLAAGDTDGDGHFELVGTGRYGVFCASDTGHLLYTRNTGDEFPGGVALADADGDGNAEIYAASRYDAFLWRFDAASGEPAWKAPLYAPVDAYSAAAIAVGDITGDGRDEIVLGDGAGHVYAFSCTGALLWTFQTATEVHAAVSLGDVTGDGCAEVLAASGDHHLYCLDGQGRLVWRHETGLRLVSPPTLTDLDGDGQTDLLLCGSDRLLRRLTTGSRYSSTAMPWPSRGFDSCQSASSLGFVRPGRVQRSVTLPLYGGFEQGKIREGLEQFDSESPFYETLMSRPRGWRLAGTVETSWNITEEKKREGRCSLLVNGAGVVVSEPVPVEAFWRTAAASAYFSGGPGHARLQWQGDHGLLGETELTRTGEETGWTRLENGNIPVPSGARRLVMALASESGPVYWDGAEVTVTLQEPTRCDVLVNQAGYTTGAPKRFVAQANFEAAAARYQVIQEDGPVLQEGTLENAGRIQGCYGNDWGFQYYTGDFTGVETAGACRVRVLLDGVEFISLPFEIAPDRLWTATARAAFRFFYYQRCGMEVPGYHGACHLDDACGPDGAGQQPLWGGWHDAGDYNKYHNAPYVFGLACAYAEQRNAFDALGTEPSGFASFFDEILWGGDHARRMVMADGSAFGPITSGYGYFGPPELETDNLPGTGDERPGNPVSGADPDMHQAALARIAVLLGGKSAMAVEHAVWVETAARSLAYSLKTGRRDLLQLSTAVDLYTCTEDASYAKIAAELCEALFPPQGVESPSALHVELARRCDQALGTRLAESLAPAVLRKAEGMLENSRNPFGVYTFGPPENPNYFGTPTDTGGFHLGTNSHLLEAAGFMALAFQMEPRPEFLVFIYDQFNWVLGLNPYNVCLMEGAGSVSLPSYHHRYTFAGVKRGAVPGGVVNGITWRAVRDDRPFLDISGRDIPAFESNEVWLPHNTAFLKALAYLKTAELK
ncbi:MAG TPA: glycoside hydrolase family 9 protein [Candidatus Hydrogenedentes bacterium]|nr:glycoside hydrolase family 9 protein [Candidatus Hydrogenedentota bacterium]